MQRQNKMNCLYCQSECVMAGVPNEVLGKCPDAKASRYDVIVHSTPEELADWMCDHSCFRCPIGDCEGRITIGREACYARWLDWLKGDYRS